MQVIENSSFEYLKGKRILVTGSMGYIGSHLCNLLTPYGVSIDQWDLLNNKNIGFLTNDNVIGVDAIVHLAALSGVHECSENKERAIYRNLKCARHVLKIAEKAKIPLVFSSSMAACEPESGFYATTKYLIEDEIFDANNRFFHETRNCFLLLNLPLMFSIRFANVYGGNDYLFDKKTVISNFINKLKKKEKCIIHGNGEQKRDFIHVSEICRFILYLLNLKFAFMQNCYNKKDEILDKVYHSFFISNGNFNSPISLGTGIQHTINEIKDMFIKYHKNISDDNFEYDPQASCGIIDSKVDTTILEKKYCFTAKDYLDEYIQNLEI